MKSLKKRSRLPRNTDDYTLHNITNELMYAEHELNKFGRIM